MTMRRAWLWIVLALGLAAAWAVGARDDRVPSSSGTIELRQLPREARETLALIRAGGQERAVDVLARVYKNRGTALKAVTGNGHAADVSVEAFRQSWYRKASALLARYGNRLS